MNRNFRLENPVQTLPQSENLDSEWSKTLVLEPKIDSLFQCRPGSHVAPRTWSISGMIHIEHGSLQVFSSEVLYSFLFFIQIEFEDLKAKSLGPRQSSCFENNVFQSILSSLIREETQNLTALQLFHINWKARDDHFRLPNIGIMQKLCFIWKVRNFPNRRGTGLDPNRSVERSS